MWKTTRYIVERQSTGATVREPEVFLDEGAALRRAAWIGRRTKARVYRVTGEPVTDIWTPRRLIAEFDGQAPAAEPVSNVVQFRRAG